MLPEMKYFWCIVVIINSSVGAMGVLCNIPRAYWSVWQGLFFSHFSLETLKTANVIPGVSDASCSEVLQKLKHGNSLEICLD